MTERDPERPPEPGPDPRAIPNAGGVRVYGENAVQKPHRPLVLTTKQRGQPPSGIESRAPFLPGVTQELPPQTLEDERAQVLADVSRRIDDLEQLLEDPNLAELTRQTIMAEISRLTQEAP